MVRYELTTITADESAVNPAVAVVEQHGGIVIHEEAVGKRRFAYPIKKLTSGVYHRVTFDAERSVIAAIDAALRHDSTVIRHLIVEQHAEPAKPAVKVEEAEIEAIGDVKEMAKAEAMAKAEDTVKTEGTEQAEATERQIDRSIPKQSADEATTSANQAAVKDESGVDEVTRQAALDEKLKSILGNKEGVDQ